MSTERVELDSLVPSYPDQHDPAIQTIIGSKAEFRSLMPQIQRDRVTPGVFKPFSDQKATARFMLQYDRAFILADPGTGKTCKFGTTAEMFKDLRDNFSNSFYNTIKRAVVLTTGDQLIDEFKRQMACNCTSGVYVGKKTGVSRKLDTFYDILTYKTFFNKIVNGEKDAQAIIKQYSNVLFFCDEIGFFQLSERITSDIPRETFHMSRALDETGKTKPFSQLLTDLRALRTTQPTKVNMYQFLWGLFHTVQNSKIMLASGAPLVNDANDFVPEFNLLLPQDRQIPDRDYSRASISELEPYFRGLILYIRLPDTGVDLVPPREAVSLKQMLNISTSRDIDIKITMSQMSEFQYQGYLRAKQKDLDSGSGGYMTNQLEASCFVFPDGSFGGTISDRGKFDSTTGMFLQSAKEGFAKYVDKISDDIYQAKPDFAAQLGNPARLREMGCKYYDTIAYCQRVPGKKFVFNKFVEGSGLIVQGLALEQYGYTRFDNNRDSIAHTQSYKVKTVCSSIEEQTRITIPKAPRYAVVIGSTEHRQRIYEIFNHPDNIDGEYISILLTSTSGAIGINLTDAIQFFDQVPVWNESTRYQAEQRVNRSTSHEGLFKRLPPGSRISVETFNMAAVHGNEETADLQVYRSSVQKEEGIRNIIDIMRRCAVDCHINRLRNFSDRNPFICYSPPPSSIDYTTQNIYYIREALLDFVERIKAVFRLQASMTYDELYAKLGIDKVAIDIILSQLIHERVLLSDRFGFQSYLVENGNRLSLTHVYPVDVVSSNLTQGYYTDNLITIDELPRPKVVGDFNIENKDVYTYKQKMDFVENSIETYYRNPSDQGALQKMNMIIGAYQHFIMIFEHEPKTSIEQHIQYRNRKTQGKKPKNPEWMGSTTKRKKLESAEGIPLVEDKMTEPIIVHILRWFTTDVKNNKLGNLLKVIGPKISANTDSPEELFVRIFRPRSSEKVWSTANYAEQIVYQRFFKRYYGQLIAVLQQRSRIYGITLHGDFLFRNMQLETTHGQETEDMRLEKTGQNCVSWKKNELIMTCIYLEDWNGLSPELRDYMKTERIEGMSSSTPLPSNIPVEYRERYRQWERRREELCKVIYNVLKKSNLILEF